MDKFVEELIRELSLVLDDTYSLVRMDSQKTNDVLLDGIRFDRKGEKVSPIVYMENYYDAYTDGRMTMKMIVKSIVKLISEKCDVEDIVEKIQQYNLIQYKIDDEKCVRCTECVDHFNAGCYMRKVLTIKRS